MDITIAAGSTLTLHAGGRRLSLKVLAATSIRGDDSDTDELPHVGEIAVLGPSEALHVGPGRVELVTPGGLITLPGRVVDDGDGMLLRVGCPSPPTQRRHEVRGEVELTIRVTLPAGSDEPEDAVRMVSGRTKNLSAGGLLASLDVAAASNVGPGSIVPIEVDLPDRSKPVSTRLWVIEVTHFGLRGSFVGLARSDAERFARVVFARERQRLAARRRRAELVESYNPPGREPTWYRRPRG